MNKRKLYGAGKAVHWATLDVLFGKFFSIISLVIIGRIIGPEGFGLVALAGFFFNLSGILISSGMNVALVNKFDRDELDYSTTFYFSISVALILYSITFFSISLYSFILRRRKSRISIKNIRFKYCDCCFSTYT